MGRGGGLCSWAQQGLYLHIYIFSMVTCNIDHSAFTWGGGAARRGRGRGAKLHDCSR